MGTVHPLFGVELDASAPGLIVEGSKTGQIIVNRPIAALHCNTCGHHVTITNPNDGRLKDGVETLCPLERCTTNGAMHLIWIVPRSQIGLA